jgi:NAD-dependent SIR2 family protein deacetylase
VHLSLAIDGTPAAMVERDTVATARGAAILDAMATPATAFDDDELAPLVALLEERRCVVLTGAGCSTESGIPDYRGAGRPERVTSPIQHTAFLRDPAVRRRYWARATIGWERFSRAEPNRAHRALAAFEREGVIAGVIKQNVDRLHQDAGSSRVVELHGALADVVCLDCGEREERAALQARLLARNPGWLRVGAATNPDGDADLAAEQVAAFEVVGCRICDGTLKPAVVFFGGSVAPSVLTSAWELFDEGATLLIVGSSLAVFSGYRFARRAAERGIRIAIVNLGPTRADLLGPKARVHAPAGEVLARAATRLGIDVS